ncbi:MAG: polysaccharide deacetylase family protein [Clostridiales bacterium]|nr:polysaccharide deacetylase family protein [Clostridiales bacterium]
MKLFGKVALCLLAAALAGYLFLVDYPRMMDKLSSVETTEATESQETDSQSADENEQVDEIVSYVDAATQVAALEEELEQLYQQYSATSVALCFEQTGEVVYDDIYPALTEQGETGTIVFTNGLLTGDNYQVMTDEFRTMMDNGWSYAIGGDDSLELTGTNAENAAAWQTSLETYMKNIRTRTGVVPTVYCFREGEYQSDYEAILEADGFTAIRYFAEDAEDDDGGSDLQKIVGIRLTENTQAETVLETLKAYPGAALLARVVAADATDEESWITLETYLSLLAELRSSDNVTITTLDAAIEAAADEEQSNLRAEIQEKEGELAEWKAQSGAD